MAALPDTLLNEVQKYFISNITSENCLDLFLLASKTNCVDLYKKCFRFIEMNCPEAILNNKSKISDFPIELFRKLLKDRSLRNVSEVVLWQIICLWVEKEDDRLSYVAELLHYLAISEIDENMAKDMLNHNIVRSNPHCKYLDGNSLENVYQSELENFKYFLKINSTPQIVSLNLRIPLRLHIVAKLCTRPSVGRGARTTKYSEIYVSFDDHLDMWIKLCEIGFHCINIVSFRNNLYLFKKSGRSSSRRLKCCKLNLRDNLLEDLELGIPLYSWIKQSNKLCIFGHPHPVIECSEIFTVFYPELHDDWFVFCTNFCTASLNGKIATTMDKIYFVGAADNPDIMYCLEYVPKCSKRLGHWIHLPAPKIFQRDFVLAALHGKLFVLGSHDVLEVFDTVTHEWKVGSENLPLFTFGLHTILNGKLYFHQHLTSDFDDHWSIFIWDESKNECKKLPESHFLKMDKYRFCEVDDEETIKFLCREGPSSYFKFEESDFYSHEMPISFIFNFVKM